VILRGSDTVGPGAERGKSTSTKSLGGWPWSVKRGGRTDLGESGQTGPRTRLAALQGRYGRSEPESRLPGLSCRQGPGGGPMKGIPGSRGVHHPDRQRGHLEELVRPRRPREDAPLPTGDRRQPARARGARSPPPADCPHPAGPGFRPRERPRPRRAGIPRPSRPQGAAPAGPRAELAREGSGAADGPERCRWCALRPMRR